MSTTAKIEAALPVRIDTQSGVKPLFEVLGWDNDEAITALAALSPEIIDASAS